MMNFFGTQTSAFFVLFSMEHMITLSVIMLISLAILRMMKYISPEHRKIVIKIIGVLLILSITGYTVWLFAHDELNIKSGLPLHVCSIAMIIAAIAAFTQWRAAKLLTWYWGFPASLIAMLFPDLIYKFPHFRFIEFFISHGLLLIMSLYYIINEKIRPDFKDLTMSYSMSLIYILIVFSLNILLGSRYFIDFKFFGLHGHFKSLSYFFLLLAGVYLIQLSLTIIPSGFPGADRRNKT